MERFLVVWVVPILPSAELLLDAACIYVLLESLVVRRLIGAHLRFVPDHVRA